MTLDRLVLASASPRRLELLTSLGLEVIVRPSTYEEPDDPSLTPRELAQRHAIAKARDVAANYGSDELIVAADTVVDVDGHALNKPRNDAEAVEMLTRLSGRHHYVHTAFTILRSGSERAIEESSTTQVKFYSLSLGEINEYVATGEPMDKAGAYGIQGRAASLVESIDGDFYTVMGFPLARFVRTLRRLGFTLPATKQRAIS